MKQIPLSKGQFAIVDDCDFEMLSQLKWHVQYHSGKYYAVASIKKGGSVRMSRMLLGITDPNIHSDHINGNSLDNRRCNLRAVTPIQNSWNRRWRPSATGLPAGVLKASGKYIAKIMHMKQMIIIGKFDTAEDAANAYLAKVKELRGEYAPSFLSTP